MFLRIALVILITSLLQGCDKITLWFTPKKTQNFSRTPIDNTAHQQFWEALHSGNYAKLPAIIKLLTAAYLENPNNSTLASHLGFAHIWKLTEAPRLGTKDPTIVDEIILARKYFSDAVQLDPNDARTLGFLGDSILVEGAIFQDPRETIRGYYTLLSAIKRWPEFNYFTAGYVMSILDPNSWQFREGLEGQWKTLSLCAKTTISKSNPNFAPYLYLETQQGPARACWNSWIAPHNFEGFFLNMGDMLVKAGDWQTAIYIYNNAKLSQTYTQWPFKDLLEKRIANAQQNVQMFRKNSTLQALLTESKTSSTPDTRMMFNSGYGCVVCHQR